ncbi:TAXI family TRAP transporter solute-binding subunit [Crassaminicella thermophila]|uniref:TAXI family TRAP transporter solute-binding subunit n=1 Tax=Crassaminicella thermophila TaxID=2599308 RepID=A0A5C0SDA8_CRATE|nr:TAXI family TRAP transporter solute-binding subunit [Crassaminicella thermophila]QEK11378.1 TAXI family TRAP transporter solute-binding subunit [Crassaminicella thermophila]
MRLRRTLVIILAMILVMVSFVGCGQKTETSSDAKPSKQFVTIVTGSTGGTYYPVGTIFSTLWNEKLGDKGVVASVQSSGGSVENLNMLKSGEAQLGIAMANLTLFAYKGEGKFKDNKFENVRFITALWPDVTQCIVTEKSGINSISDLKGKRFNVGGAGSGTEYSCKLILEHVGGLTFDDVNTEHLGYFEASSAMQNGQLDGMNAEGGLPTSAVSEIFASKTPVKMLEFSDEDYKKLHDVAPYYGQFTVPAGLYSKLDKDIKTVGIKSALIASADLDEDLVYELVKSIYENYDEISSSHKALEFVKLEEAIKGLPPVPLHPGAVRYYKEKGIEIPEELLP